MKLGALPLLLATVSFGVLSCSSMATSTLVKTPVGVVATAVAGNTNPTVVLQSGLGDGKDAWRDVFPLIAVSSRVFAYDRPGYGDSTSVKSPRDPCTTAAELQETLRASNLEPPYVLVGHSLGGLYQFVFAKLYPQDVAGLVLLDPTHPDHWQRMQTDAPAIAALLKGLSSTLFDSTRENEFDNQTTCLEHVDIHSPINIPARLLTRTQFQGVETGSFETMVHTLENDWMRLLSARNIHKVAGAGHYIQKERPSVVAQEVRALIGELPFHAR